MKRTVCVESITQRLPRGFKLPKLFKSFANVTGKKDAAVFGWFDIKWTNLNQWQLSKEAAAQLDAVNQITDPQLGDGAVRSAWQWDAAVSFMRRGTRQAGYECGYLHHRGQPVRTDATPPGSAWFIGDKPAA